MKNLILTLFKGMFIGGTMLIPGVSGGSMAIILGIYDRLISSISRFFKNIKSNVIFLAIFGIGAVAGMILFAKPISYLKDMFEKPVMFFFIGCVAGSIPMMLKKAQVKKVSWKCFVFPIVGILFVILIALIPTGGTAAAMSGSIFDYLLLVLAGFLAAIALVLPGISVSFFLLLIGVYDDLINSIETLNIPFLIPIFIGLVLGVILTTKLLEAAMNKFPQPTYLIILGFIVGSIAEIFPGLPGDVFEYIICAVTLALGFIFIWLLSRLENNKDSVSDADVPAPADSVQK